MGRRKRQIVIAERGVDILRAARIFEHPVLQTQDGRADYGEIRFRALGMVDEDCYVVVWTPRGPNRRLITAWKGGQDEREAYQNGVARRDHRDGPPR